MSRLKVFGRAATYAFVVAGLLAAIFGASTEQQLWVMLLAFVAAQVEICGWVIENNGLKFKLGLRGENV